MLGEGVRPPNINVLCCAAVRQVCACVCSFSSQIGRVLVFWSSGDYERQVGTTGYPPPQGTVTRRPQSQFVPFLREVIISEPRSAMLRHPLLVIAPMQLLTLWSVAMTT